jgi:hypothetical protein
MNQEEFYGKIPEWIAKPKSTWNHITLMAYFCHKYEQKNGVKFRLVRWKSDPGKGKESRDFAKLFKTLAPEDYASFSKEKKKQIKEEVTVKIYNYINWMFDYKFRRGDRSVTGTKIFLMPAMINEFERMYSTFLAKKKSENSLGSLLLWARDHIPDIFDFHEIEDVRDLKMLQTYSESYSLEENSLESILLKKAKEMNLV